LFGRDAERQRKGAPIGFTQSAALALGVAAKGLYLVSFKLSKTLFGDG